MEEFSIKGENGNYLKITFQEIFGFPEKTCHWGGYELRATLEIKSGDFTAKSSLYTSTGEIYEFYTMLRDCNERLSGLASLENFEGELKLSIQFTNLGQVNVSGSLSKVDALHNELNFELNSDQSYITGTIDELKKIVAKYGGMSGLKS
ncbi:hypothetical protein GU926_17175 [Nibribacter ruber]|uniref:Uncharacterized protein n=1 Tax=Nibribacter ruber TaxID=2698458 RepID=A0A6P1P3X5_9BACT|nr:hypothetical protein [Nibribacter ruber]QHL89065.1 hypothetical protein GU926_17175 [Nibribacter ruber]